MKININALETLCETLCKELEKYSVRREIDKQSLANIHEFASSADKILSIIDKAIMREHGDIGYSQADEYPMHAAMRAGYNHGNSYANRGKHYVRGHYSRDGWDMHGNYEARGGYSRDNGNTREMLDGADARERDAIMRCLKEIGD